MMDIILLFLLMDRQGQENLTQSKAKMEENKGFYNIA